MRTRILILVLSFVLSACELNEKMEVDPFQGCEEVSATEDPPKWLIHRYGEFEVSTMRIWTCQMCDYAEYGDEQIVNCDPKDP